MNVKLLLLFLTPSILLFFTGEHLILYLIIVTVLPFLLAGLFFKQRVHHSKPAAILFAFLLLHLLLKALSAAQGIEPGLSISQLSRDLTIIIWLIVTYQFFLKSSHQHVHFKQLQDLILTLSVILSLISILTLLPQFPNPSSGLNLIYATFGHSHLSSFTLLAFPILIVRLIQHPTKQSILILTFLTGTFLLTFSRSAFLALGVILLFTTFYFKKLLPSATKKMILAGSIFIFTLIISVWTFAATNYGQHLFHEGQSHGWLYRQVIKPLESEGRLGYWQQALIAFQDQPLFGNGPGTFKLINLHYRSDAANDTNFAQNIWLEALSETGLVGTSLLLIFIGYLVSRHHQVIQKLQSFSQLRFDLFITASSLLGVLVQAHFDTNLNIYSLQFFIASYIAVFFALTHKSPTRPYVFAQSIQTVIAVSVMVLLTFNFTRIIGFFYLFKTAQSTSKSEGYELALQYMPYEIDLWTTYFQTATIETHTIPSSISKLHQQFHALNPATLYAYAQYKKLVDLTGYLDTLEKVKIQDPTQSYVYTSEQIKTLIQNNETAQAVAKIKEIAELFVSQHKSASPALIFPTLLNYSIHELPQSAFSSLEFNQLLSTIQYDQLILKDTEYVSKLLLSISEYINPADRLYLQQLAAVLSYKNILYHQTYLTSLVEAQADSQIRDHIAFCKQTEDVALFCEQFWFNYQIVQVTKQIQQSIDEKNASEFYIALNHLINLHFNSQPSTTPIDRPSLTLPQNQDLTIKQQSKTSSYLSQPLNSNTSTSKLLYDLGLTAYQYQEIELTTSFMQAATYISPDWDMFHKELLNLYALTKQSQKIYNHYLYCIQFTAAKPGCKETVYEIEDQDIYQPGFQQNLIFYRL